MSFSKFFSPKSYRHKHNTLSASDMSEHLSDGESSQGSRLQVEAGLDDDLYDNISSTHVYFCKDMADFTNRDNMKKIRTELTNVVDEAQEIIVKLPKIILGNIHPIVKELQTEHANDLNRFIFIITHHFIPFIQSVNPVTLNETGKIQNVVDEANRLHGIVLMYMDAIECLYSPDFSSMEEFISHAKLARRHVLTSSQRMLRHNLKIAGCCVGVGCVVGVLVPMIVKGLGMTLTNPGCIIVGGILILGGVGYACYCGYIYWKRSSTFDWEDEYSDKNSIIKMVNVMNINIGKEIESRSLNVFRSPHFFQKAKEYLVAVAQNSSSTGPSGIQDSENYYVLILSNLSASLNSTTYESFSGFFKKAVTYNFINLCHLVENIKNNVNYVKHDKSFDIIYNLLRSIWKTDEKDLKFTLRAVSDVLLFTDLKDMQKYLSVLEKLLPSIIEKDKLFYSNINTLREITKKDVQVVVDKNAPGMSLDKFTPSINLVNTFSTIVPGKVPDTYLSAMHMAYSEIMSFSINNNCEMGQDEKLPIVAYILTHSNIKNWFILIEFWRIYFLAKSDLLAIGISDTVSNEIKISSNGSGNMCADEFFLKRKNGIVGNTTEHTIEILHGVLETFMVDCKQ